MELILLLYQFCLRKCPITSKYYFISNVQIFDGRDFIGFSHKCYANGWLVPGLHCGPGHQASDPVCYHPYDETEVWWQLDRNCNMKIPRCTLLAPNSRPEFFPAARVSIKSVLFPGWIFFVRFWSGKVEWLWPAILRFVLWLLKWILFRYKFLVKCRS